jgi:uncharacterized membrane protein HdeD (DUF308 family)
MLGTMSRNWWALVLRGIAAIAFGVLVIARPDLSLTAFILAFAIYAIAEGVVNVVGSLRGAARHERWGALFVEGLVSIGAGLVALFWPGLTALALLFWIGAWAILTGALEIGAAIKLRRELEHEWLLGLAGVLSIAFGAAVIASPSSGALALLLWIGAYAIMFGVLLFALGVRLGLRSRHEAPAMPFRQQPTPT